MKKIIGLFFGLMIVIVPMANAQDDYEKYHEWTINQYQRVSAITIGAKKLDWPDEGWNYKKTFERNGDTINCDVPISKGPGEYELWAELKDEDGNILFHSPYKESVTLGMGENIVVFFISPNTHIQVRFDIDDLDDDDVVLINGIRAYLDDGLWGVNISRPWMLDNLSIYAEGYGGITIPINPSDNLWEVVELTPENFDGSTAAPSTVSAIFALENNAYDRAFEIVEWDRHSIQVETELEDYNEILIVLKAEEQVWYEAHEHYHSRTVEYHRALVSFDSTSFIYDLPEGLWLKNDTIVQFIFVGEDDMLKYCDDWTIYNDTHVEENQPSSGGGSGGGSSAVEVTVVQ